MPSATMKYQNAKVAPCPFCKGKKIDLRMSETAEGKDVLFLHCIGCQATGPTAPTEEAAINAWGSPVRHE